MAQAETRPTATVVGGPTKLRIKLKLPFGAKKPRGTQNGPAISTGNQLADLHAAVEAFCQQGVRGLPGAVLLSPWRGPSPIEQLAQQQQVDGFSLPGMQHLQQQLPELQQQHGPARRRVRKRREPEPAADDFAQLEVQQLGWGSIKRRRSNNHRAARDAAQLSSSIHSMLQAVPAGQGSPASPSVVSQAHATDVVVRSRAISDGGVKPAAQQPSRLHRASAPGFAAVGSIQTEPAATATHLALPAVAATVGDTAALSQHTGPMAMDVDEQPAADSAQPRAPSANNTQAGGRACQQPQQQEARQRTPQPELKQADSKPQLLQQQQKQEQPAIKQSPMSAAHPSKQQKQAQQQMPAPNQQNKPGAGQKAVPVDQEQKQAQPTAEAPTELIAGTSGAEYANTPAVDAGIAQAVPVSAAAAAVPPAMQDEKPDSPASETSHQQHLQELLPNTIPPQHDAPDQQQQQQAQMPELQGEVLQQPKQPEQTAVSRDRSQCSLQRAAEAPRGSAAVSMPAPAAVPAALLAPAAGGGSGRLLELATGAMTPAARALASLSAVPEVRQRVLPPEDRPVRTQEEALSYLSSIMEKAKQLKHSGDKRHNQLNGWDVFGLSFYALSTVEFLMYWDTANRLLGKLRAQEQPVERLQQQISSLSSAQFLRQTGQLSTTAMNICSNCKGADVAKQALRMLLERLSAISNLRNLHNQRKQLESHIRVLKSNGASIGNGSSSGNGIRSVQQQPQQVQQGQQQPRVQAQQMSAGKPPSPSGSSWSPAGPQNFNKRSPDDSNTSNQERLQLPVGTEHGGAVGMATGGAALGAGGHVAALQAERALALAKSERALLDSMQELLKMTDGMHQTVMRMQQFLESPDVLASEHARAAALHISVLGLDAGMFSIPRVAAHTEAAVTCLTKLLRSGS